MLVAASSVKMVCMRVWPSTNATASAPSVSYSGTVVKPYALAACSAITHS
jgi:hypothetical protein